MGCLEVGSGVSLLKKPTLDPGRLFEMYHSWARQSNQNWLAKFRESWKDLISGTVLIALLDDICWEMKKENVTLLILLYFWVPFDTTDCGILLDHILGLRLSLPVEF